MGTVVFYCSVEQLEWQLSGDFRFVGDQMSSVGLGVSYDIGYTRYI